MIFVTISHSCWWNTRFVQI